MNNTVTKSSSMTDCVFASGSRKKFRKKRHRNRNRNRNISLKKKRLRKFYSTNKTGSCKSNIFKPSWISEKIMSNWYWSNYKKAVEWQNKHKIAHWKSCALALLEENRYLLQIINNLQPSIAIEVPVTQQNLSNELKIKKDKMKMKTLDFSNFPYDDYHKKINFEMNDTSDDNDDADDKNAAEENDEIEFEMSEEMMEFFAQSYKRKMDLQKLQEKELPSNMDQEVQQIQSNKMKRSTEMNFLYGEGASMIIGMETAVQLSFDKYCDTKSPKYWPNIPLKL